MDTAQAFWNDTFDATPGHRLVDDSYGRDNRTTRAFLDLLGDVRGKTVLDVGCGAGDLSVWLAQRGATVTATDLSASGVAKTRALAEHNGVADAVAVRQMDALALADLGERFDLVVGIFILHHIEPFAAFVDVLAEVTAAGGRGVFLENNARNPFLMLARSHLAGRFGIPRYGDDDEHPLEPREVAMLERRFDVLTHTPELIFLRKLNTYLFRHKPAFRPVYRLTEAADAALYRALPPIRAWSYRQIVELGTRG